MSCIGVTGTDTGVGKTVVASAIIASLRESGTRVAPMKPVETGGGDDAERLRKAAGDLVPLELVRPYAFAEPLAPLVAARRARRKIDPDVLDEAFAALRTASDIVVVEGAGGLLVPLTETLTNATLFKRWDLELIIVAANRLGTVNHTLLTVESALAHGLVVRAVVLNKVSKDQYDLSERTNQALLKELLLTVPVVTFPFTSQTQDLAHLAEVARTLSAPTITRPV